MRRTNKHPAHSASWDGVADWYAGWAGPSGSHYHRTLAVPLLLDLLQLRRGERLADLGCGHGVLAPTASRAGIRMVGIDLSNRLIEMARRTHGRIAEFITGDVTALPNSPALAPSTFDAASFMFSIQDIDPVEDAIASAARLLRPGGRLGIVMLHPCFRVPRQSGWGFDTDRALHFRRIDSYTTRLAVPMQPYRGGRTTRSYHRPLSDYFAALRRAGLVVTDLREVTDEDSRAEKSVRRAMAEFPLLLGIRAEKR